LGLQPLENSIGLCATNHQWGMKENPTDGSLLYVKPTMSDSWFFLVSELHAIIVTLIF
jgi:hypothetical protein